MINFILCEKCRMKMEIADIMNRVDHKLYYYVCNTCDNKIGVYVS